MTQAWRGAQAWTQLLQDGGGLTSVCSAHPRVIEATLREAAERGGPTLIEATCNQVNQFGGYTGLTPAGFRELVFAAARRVGLPTARVILGGDHLGPNPWRSLPAKDAMAHAEAMVAAYVEAGFEKIHLDTSMGCGNEPASLGDDIVAARAARLAVVAEAQADRTGLAPRYVIGTEVPTPGGALEEISHLDVTRAEAVLTTHDAHQRAFAAAGAQAAFARVVALVVQPGVEFGHTDVAIYQPDRAADLSAALGQVPGVVFEAHSTDYQPPAALAALVRDRFAILKVGPALTFAMREALYGLDAIAGVLDPSWRERSLAVAMERVMLENPAHWRAHYHGTPDQQRVLRHYSYSDRIRYYWPAPAARLAECHFLALLSGVTLPQTLISQFLPKLHPRVLTGELAPEAEALVMQSVRDVLRVYAEACA